MLNYKQKTKEVTKMANKKTPKGSGFDAPVRGTQYPKGTTFKKDKDGYLIPVLPKKKK